MFLGDVLFQLLLVIEFVRSDALWRWYFGNTLLWKLRQGAAHVGPLMHCKVCFLIKTSGTAWIAAGKRFLTRVNALVDLHIEFESKALSTDFTLIGLFSSVNDDVPFELIFVMEHSVAARVSATEGTPIVDLKVLFQGKLGQKVSSVVTHVAKILFAIVLFSL